MPRPLDRHDRKKGRLRLTVWSAVVLALLAISVPTPASAREGRAAHAAPAPNQDPEETVVSFQEADPLNVHYLEIVTPRVDATCEALETAHGVSFGEPVAELGGARTATLASGGRIGVRGPLRETEEPVVRPYLLVEDIDAAVEAVREAGGEIALPPTEVEGQGTFAIYLLGGIQHGLWQL